MTTRSRARAVRAAAHPAGMLVTLFAAAGCSSGSPAAATASGAPADATAIAAPGSSSASSGSSASSAPATSSAAVKRSAAPAEPRVAGAFSSKVITDRPFGVDRIVPTSQGLAVYVGDVGGGRIQLGRLAGSDWKLEAIQSESMMSFGHIAARGDTLAMTARTLDMNGPITFGIAWLEPGKEPTKVLSGCALGDHAVTIDSHGPVIVGNCNERITLVTPGAGGWRERASWPEPHAIVYGAAADDQDRIHVQLIANGADHDYVVKGSEHRDAALPAGARIDDLAACGGTVHAVFEMSGGAGSFYLALGTFAGDRWNVEKIADLGGGTARLGFDAECRPFVAMGTSVWSKGSKHWVSSTIDATGEIKSLAGDHDHLYAAYEEIHDGVEVGIASAPLVPEP